MLTLLAAFATSFLLLAFVPGVSRGQDSANGPPDPSTDEAPGGAPYASGELLVAFESGAADAVAESVARGAGAEVEKTIPEINARVLAFPEIKNERAREARQQGLERARQALERSPAVRSADYNYVAQALFTPNDPGFGDQYGYDIARFPRAWDYTRGGNAKIGIVDSGIDRGHPDVADKVVSSRDFTGSGSVQDDGGHGTHVAGTAAALTNNGEGVAGGCITCDLLVAKSLDGGSGTYADIADGIVWAAYNGADVVNLSLGGRTDAQSLEDAVDYAWNQGAVVVAAAGNTGDDTVIYPAAYENALGTAATDRNDDRASFSTYGRSVDIAAPGRGILSTYLRSKSDYEYLSGTSMAAPHVAGLAGLMASQGLGNDRIRTRLENTAEDLGADGDDRFYGAGRIDATRAVLKPPYRQVVDNADRDRFSASGRWRAGRNNNEKFRGNYRFTRPARINDSAAFKVKIPRRDRYEIFGWWPSASNYNNRTVFRIKTVSGVQKRAVNQRRVGGKWVKLGTYSMRRGDRYWIKVQRNTSGDGAIMADAVLVREKQ